MPEAQSDKMAQEVLGTVIAAATNSPIATSNHIMRIWQNIAPGGVTPRVGEQMQAIMKDPTWTNLNKFITKASQDPTVRAQFDRAVDAWYHEVFQGMNMGWKEVDRYGQQNTPAFTGGR
jgi:hypothetical protein